VCTRACHFDGSPPLLSVGRLSISISPSSISFSRNLSLSFWCSAALLHLSIYILSISFFFLSWVHPHNTCVCLLSIYLFLSRPPLLRALVGAFRDPHTTPAGLLRALLHTPIGPYSLCRRRRCRRRSLAPTSFSITLSCDCSLGRERVRGSDATTGETTHMPQQLWLVPEAAALLPPSWRRGGGARSCARPLMRPSSSGGGVLMMRFLLRCGLRGAPAQDVPREFPSGGLIHEPFSSPFWARPPCIFSEIIRPNTYTYQLVPVHVWTKTKKKKKKKKCL
jgi:hypothetical protein